MGENQGDDLGYGHFKKLQYNSEDRQWLSTRRFHRRARPFLHYGHEHNWIPANPVPPRQDDIYAKDVTRQTYKLGGSYPEVTPAFDVLEDVANSLPEHFNYHDEDNKEQTDLLSFGFAHGPHGSVDGQYTHRVPLVAFPHGQNGEILCVMEMRRSRTGWQDSKNFWVNTFHLDNTPAAFIPGPGASIRQVMFADPLDSPATLLAVRYPLCIRVFRMQYSSDRAVNQKGILATRIIPEQLLSIASNDYGEEFVHMAFNPLDQHQLAVIDSKGKWRILWMQREKFGDKRYSARQRHQGQSVHASSTPSDSSEHLHRRFLYRVLWGYNSASLAVCAEDTIELYGLFTERTHVAFHCASAGARKDLILDIKKDYTGENVFVLTLESLTWLKHHVVGIGESFNDADAGGLKPVFSWKHHLHTADQSVRLIVCDRSEGAFTAFIIACESEIILEIPMCFCEGSDDFVELEYVPTRFHIPSMIFGNEKRKTLDQDAHESAIERKVLDIRLKFLSTSWSISAGEEAAQTYATDKVKFYQVIALSSDYGLGGFITGAIDTSDGQGTPHAIASSDSKVAAVDWTMIRKMHASRRRVTMQYSFVVDSDEDSEHEEDALTIERTPEQDLERRQLLNSLDPWTISNVLLYNFVVDSSAKDNMEFLPWLRQVTTDIEQTAEAVEHLQLLDTLSNFLELTVSSLDVAASTVSEVFELLLPVTASRPFKMALTEVIDPTHVGLAQPVARDGLLLAIYNRVLEGWLKPLPATMPNKARLAKERIARQIAAMVCVSCIGFAEHKQAIPSQESNAGSQGQATNDGAEPVASSSSSASRHQTDGPLHLPNRQNSYNESDHNASRVGALHEALDGLRKYTMVDATLPPREANRGLSEVVAHWQLEMDPAEYDYEVTTATLAGQTLIEGGASISVAEQQQREQRLERRRALEAARRMRKARQDPSVVASQPTGAYGRSTTSSQPGFLDSSYPAGLSSQASTSQALPDATASQVEAGRFGGRPVLLPSRRKSLKRKGF